MISFSGDATDTEDGTLPASAYTWSIDFLHEGHVHPGAPITGVKSGTFTIPTIGHDFSGFTRYRITLTVTDSDGLTDTQSVTVSPTKVNLTFDTVTGRAHAVPRRHRQDRAIRLRHALGFSHTIEARNQTLAATTYTFASWSDGGAQTAHDRRAQFRPVLHRDLHGHATPAPARLCAGECRHSADQSNASHGDVHGAQTAGNTNILAIGWNNATSNITSVTDSAGNVYQIAVSDRRRGRAQPGDLLRDQHQSGAAGTNTVTVRSTTRAVRRSPHHGIQRHRPVNPFDATACDADGGCRTLMTCGRRFLRPVRLPVPPHPRGAPRRTRLRGLRGTPWRLPLGGCRLEARLATRLEQRVTFASRGGGRGAAPRRARGAGAVRVSSLLGWGASRRHGASRSARQSFEQARQGSNPGRRGWSSLCCRYTTGLWRGSGRPGSNGPLRSGVPVLFRLSYVRVKREASGR